MKFEFEIYMKLIMYTGTLLGVKKVAIHNYARTAGIKQDHPIQAKMDGFPNSFIFM